MTNNLAKYSPKWRDTKVIILCFCFISPITRQSGEIDDLRLKLLIEGITEGVIKGRTKNDMTTDTTENKYTINYDVG
jgi:hypothetical protein